MDEDKRQKTCTTDGKPPRQGYENSSAPAPKATNGQHEAYWILCEDERKKGFIRPVRQKYYHIKCKTETTMAIALAETYARDPKYYGATFCYQCGNHFPVGEYGEFFWIDKGEITTEKVGT